MNTNSDFFFFAFTPMGDINYWHTSTEFKRGLLLADICAVECKGLVSGCTASNISRKRTQKISLVLKDWNEADL